MSQLPQVSHERVVKALKRAGFYVLREGKHISMTDDKHLVIIPRHHTINQARHSPTHPQRRKHLS
jgi:predicted RNA binding protein YcfA (HicA-like mRNA interferase family)